MALTQRTSLIVAPHQDDETLGCGGLIALKRASGLALHVVFLTDGGAAIKTDSHESQKDFVRRRRLEALAALKILNVEENRAYFLDIADSTLRETGASESAVERLSSLLATLRPQEIYAPHRADGHPDHEAAWRITCSAVQRAELKVDLIQYSIWMLWSAPLFLRLFSRHLAGARRLCIRPVRAQKQRAIAAYASQCATLPRGFLGQFLRADEIFFFQNEQ